MVVKVADMSEIMGYAFAKAPGAEQEQGRDAWPAASSVGLKEVEALLAPELPNPEDSPVLPLVASALESLVEMNEHREQLAQKAVPEDLPPRLTVFHGLRAPPITTEAYLLRIAKYAKCSPACFVAALGYMQRLSGRDAALAPTTLNVHRLLLTGVLCAAKFLDDRYYNNAFYAKVGGISTLELNRLELEMLQLLEFRLAISPEAVATLLAQLHSGSYVLEAAGGGGAALLPPGALLGACCEAGAAPRASSDTVAGSAGGVLYGRKRRSINGNSCEVDARRLQRRSMEVVEA